jgi:hypothetical protein
MIHARPMTLRHNLHQPIGRAYCLTLSNGANTDHELDKPPKNITMH